MRPEGLHARPGLPPQPPDDGAMSPPVLRQRQLVGPLPAPGFAALCRDSYETPSFSAQPSDQLMDVPLQMGAMSVEMPPPPEIRRGPWRRLCSWLPCYWQDEVRDRAQTANQRGWLGHCIRWMPLIGVVIGCISLYFAVRNFKLIFAQRTFALLRQTSPALQRAHNDILDGLAKIQRELGITNTSVPEPDLPPEQSIHSGR